MILKSIFGKRNRMTPLFIEIVIVTVIGWIIIEPVAVNTSIALTPAGYDYDRLVAVTINSIDPKSAKYDKNSEELDKEKAYFNLLRMIREREGVEKATFSYYQSFEMNGRSSNSLRADSAFLEKGIEDITYSMTCIEYAPNTDFFSTFGIKDVNGKDFQEPEIGEDSFIISNSVAKGMFPDESPVGKELFPPTEWRPSAIKVSAVTADMPYRKGDGRIGTYFMGRDFNSWSKPHTITIRLGEGVNPRKFIESLTADLSKYHSGNFISLIPYI